MRQSGGEGCSNMRGTDHSLCLLMSQCSQWCLPISTSSIISGAGTPNVSAMKQVTTMPRTAKMANRMKKLMPIILQKASTKGTSKMELRPIVVTVTVPRLRTCAGQNSLEMRMTMKERMEVVMRYPKLKTVCTMLFSQSWHSVCERQMPTAKMRVMEKRRQLAIRRSNLRRKCWKRMAHPFEKAMISPSMQMFSWNCYNSKAGAKQRKAMMKRLALIGKNCDRKDLYRKRSIMLNTFACFFRWFSSYSSLISFTPYRVNPWSVTLFHLAIRMKALQVSVQSSAAMSSMGVFSTMKQKPMRVSRVGIRNTKITTFFQSLMKQKAMGLTAVPTANDNVSKLKYCALFFSGKNSTMKVVMIVKELARPALQRKTPMTLTVCEWISVKANPMTEINSPRLVVPLRPRCSVKKMVTKTPNTDPRIIMELASVTNSDPSHLKSPNSLAKLVRPSQTGVQGPRSSGGRLQTQSLQLTTSGEHWKLCWQKMQGLMRRQAEPSMPTSTMNTPSMNWYRPSVPTFSSMLQQMRSLVGLCWLDINQLNNNKNEQYYLTQNRTIPAIRQIILKHLLIQIGEKQQQRLIYRQMVALRRRKESNQCQ